MEFNIILKPIMSVICSSETLFFCTFLQIEKGVFSLPIIWDSRAFWFNTSVNSLDTLLILVVMFSPIVKNYVNSPNSQKHFNIISNKLGISICMKKECPKLNE